MRILVVAIACALAALAMPVAATPTTVSDSDGDSVSGATNIVGITIDSDGSEFTLTLDLEAVPDTDEGYSYSFTLGLPAGTDADRVLEVECSGFGGCRANDVRINPYPFPLSLLLEPSRSATLVSDTNCGEMCVEEDRTYWDELADGTLQIGIRGDYAVLGLSTGDLVEVRTGTSCFQGDDGGLLFPPPCTGDVMDGGAATVAIA